jgi:PEP-CTERM motif
MKAFLRMVAVPVVVAMLASPVSAGTFFFSTGTPDGKIATLSRPSSPGKLETESADDFILTQPTRIDSATFTGLLPLGASLSTITQVEIEFYHIFPQDSVNPPSGHVPTRVNSPADNEIGSATRGSLAGTLSFTPGILSPSFTAANSVVNGIHPIPNVFTGGEGPVTGQEVQFNVLFTTPVLLPADQYFFRPEVGLSSGDFLWLSAPKPIVAPGTPFASDLQSWIRNSDLDPDWMKIGTDITHQGPFNATFSLSGATVPEPTSLLLLGSGLTVLAAWRRRRLMER